MAVARIWRRPRKAELKVERRVLTGEHFMDGDTACAEGALAAGLTFFGGYPITPSSEIAEHMARRLPAVGGVMIQMEDELASMAAILGAAWGGARSMTATSGPGFSLMMENIGLGVMTETPCVVVNIQRGGPSTGLPTLVAQSDMMQARWGSHGDYEMIALSPASPQECFDLMIHAFRLSEEYRTPVMLMADEVVGHMSERVIIPPAERLPKVERRRSAEQGKNGNGVLIPPMYHAGEGHYLHITGLTHDMRGYPATDPQTQEQLVTRLMRKIRDNVERIVMYRQDNLDDAEVALISYGVSARCAEAAMRVARSRRQKVGTLQLQVVWPMPEAFIRDLAKRVKAIIVPEINMGQIVREIERLAGRYTEVISCPHAGGEIIHPERILTAIERVSP
jgi:2-oxoglutarate ferredoxin oxidoreductase subunit alpha